MSAAATDGEGAARRLVLVGAAWACAACVVQPAPSPVTPPLAPVDESAARSESAPTAPAPAEGEGQVDRGTEPAAVDAEAPAAATEAAPDTALFVIVIDGKLGYMDREGRVVIEPRYQTADEFSEGLAAVRLRGGKWGYIDGAGNDAIYPRFDYALAFHDGYAAVRADGKWGFIDTVGNYSVEPRYERIYRFGGGVWSFVEGGKQGLVDGAGKVVIAPEYEHISPFDDGWAFAKRDGRWFFVDRNGDVALDPTQGEVGWPFSEGLTPIRVAVGGKRRGKQRHRWGYLGRDGALAIEAKFVRASSFSEGLAAVETDARMGFLWGYTDTEGNVVIAPQWHSVGEFHEGLAAVKVGEKYGYIDRTGALAIAADFDWAGDFDRGLARVELHSCSDADRNAAGKCMKNRTDRIGYIDLTGAYVWQPTNSR